MVTRDPDASFDTPNVVIGRQGRNELTLSFRPDPYLLQPLVPIKTDHSTNMTLSDFAARLFPGAPLGQRLPEKTTGPGGR